MVDAIRPIIFMLLRPFKSCAPFLPFVSLGKRGSKRSLSFLFYYDHNDQMTSFYNINFNYVHFKYSFTCLLVRIHFSKSKKLSQAKFDPSLLAPKKQTNRQKVNRRHLLRRNFWWSRFETISTSKIEDKRAWQISAWNYYVKISATSSNTMGICCETIENELKFGLFGLEENG